MNLIREFIKGSSPSSTNFKLKCIVCDYDLTGKEQKCPNCDTPLDSMFTKECPKCHYENMWSAKKCQQCGTDIENEPPSGTEIKKKEVFQEDKLLYRCPICGFKADYPFNVCPVCGQELA
ncbi:zinc ribbon domain-containing protein [Candidatus Micrarchaeota archaeon]|nr:zinc ribbon domain-containing protein [Candidatus Micrarchaeota archaeon]